MQLPAAPLTAQPITHPRGTGYLPGLAIDLVIFGFHQGQLKILLLEYENTGLFALPAGFIRQEENVNDAARRGWPTTACTRPAAAISSTTIFFMASGAREWMGNNEDLWHLNGARLE